jgi:hypothetical protein
MKLSFCHLLLLAFTILIQGCNVIPDDALTEFPNTADYAGLTYSNRARETYNANIKREGDEYIFDWGDSEGVFKNIGAVAISRVVTSGDKLMSVKHFNSSDSLLQSIEITYNDQGFESINVNVRGLFSISDTFFYKDAKLDSMAREKRYISGEIENGFLKDATLFRLDNSILFGEGDKRFLFVQNYLDTPTDDLDYPEEYFQYIADNNADSSLILEIDEFLNSYFNSPSLSSSSKYGSYSSYLTLEPVSNKVFSYRESSSYRENSGSSNEMRNIYFNSLMLIPCEQIYEQRELLGLLYQDLITGSHNSDGIYSESAVEFKMTYAHE